jgi:hypothetical protein
MCEHAGAQFVLLWLRDETNAEDAAEDAEDNVGESQGSRKKNYNYFFAAVFLKIIMLNRPTNNDIASASGAELLTMRYLRRVLRGTDDDSLRLCLWAHFGPDCIAVARFSTLIIVLPVCTAHGWSESSACTRGASCLQRPRCCLCPD